MKVIAMPPKALAYAELKSIQTYDNLPKARKSSNLRNAAKRSFDMMFALLFLIAFAPIMLLIALAIKIEGKGSIFYTQARTGYKGKPFNFYKFRSMIEHNTPINTLDYVKEGDPRVTKWARFCAKPALMNCRNYGMWLRAICRWWGRAHSPSTILSIIVTVWKITPAAIMCALVLRA